MLILVTYVFLVQNFMLITKKYGVIFLGLLKVIFRPLEVMTLDLIYLVFLFIYF